MIRCPFCLHDNPEASAECAQCGATLSGPGKLGVPMDELEIQIEYLLKNGYKIEAIKLFREATGAGLKEAKDAVEAIEQSRPPALPRELDQDPEGAIAELLRTGRKIEAIKRFREQTGAGLKEAKDAVEALEHGRPLAVSGGPGEEFERELIELLQAGEKIEAIKMFRERTGTRLKEAKDAVERLAAAHGLAVPREAGCLSVLLLAAMLIIEVFLA